MSWACPVCAESLARVERTLRCERGHSFDLAKEGHCNLLLANQKRSKDPGDSKAMLQGRRAFLQAGFYRPLSDAICAQFSALLDAQDAQLALLDCGCGEGYYSAELARALAAKIYAIDIARDGVRMTQKLLRERAECAVASSFRLPLLDQSMDMVLQVFAPVDAQELARVLRPGGIYCEVSPGPEHLLELKRKLYDNWRSYSAPVTPDGFSLIAQQSVQFELALESQEMIHNLLLMTPFYFNGSREAKAQLAKLAQLNVQADFVVRLYRCEDSEHAEIVDA